MTDTPYEPPLHTIRLGDPRCSCGAPVRHWPESETCAYDDTGYPYCRVCKENHRAPECAIDATDNAHYTTEEGS